MPDTNPAAPASDSHQHADTPAPARPGPRRRQPRARALAQVATFWIARIAVFYLLATSLFGVETERGPRMLVLSALWAIVNFLVYPTLNRLALPSHVFAMGTALLVLNAAVLWVLSGFTGVFHVEDPQLAMFSVTLLTGVMMLMHAPVTDRVARQILVWTVQLLAFSGLIAVLPGLTLEDEREVLPVLLVWAALNLLVRPLVVRLTMPVTVFSIGFFSLVLNGGILWLVSRLVDGFVVRDLQTATVGGVLLTAGMMVVNNLLYDESESYYRGVARRLRWQYRSVEETDVPGVVFLEIDGLAYPSLARAVREGHVPNLASWLQEDGYQLMPWHAELPSQTSAMQAGILYGNNFNIPAFRWYDKERQRMIVSTMPFDAREIAQRVSDGRGLLHPDGTSIGNVIHGDAPPSRSLLTASSVADRREGLKLRPTDFNSFFQDPSSFTRALVLTLWELVVELWEAFRQRWRDVRPRVSRSGHYPLVRALSGAALRDMTVHFVMSSLFEGAPIVYATFTGYDETAHHAGPESPDAMRVLHHIDERIERLAQVAHDAPRPYKFVLLSDHGQSPGAPFRQRYGQTLPELVEALVHRETGVGAGADQTEATGQINTLLTELLSAFRFMGRIGRFLLRSYIDDGYVNIEQDHAPDATPDAPAEAVVCVSGNLAHIYFPAHPGRLTREAIDRLYPDVIGGLLAHEGIGFIMVRSEADGPVVLGSGGAHHLKTGAIDGQDPLAPFGPFAAEDLRRLDQFENAGDIVVNSMYDPATGEVAPFEEFVGSHGGLGGAQNEAFVIFPPTFSVSDAEIVDARHLHRIFRRWLDEAQGNDQPLVAAETLDDKQASPP